MRMALLNQWQQVIEDNQAIPTTARCKLIGSELAVETEGDPVWIRQYPIPEGYRAAVDAQVQQWIDQGLVVPAPPGCKWNLTTIGSTKTWERWSS